MTAAIAKAAIVKIWRIRNEPSRKYLGSLFLVAALATPVTIMAVPAPQADREHKRVYDRAHKDYHHWDDNENRAWGQFLTENHRESHQCAKSNKKEQSEYWNYRHSHPDKN